MSVVDNKSVVETVAVFAAPDQMTAEVVRGVLESEGIDAFIGEQVTSSLGSAFATGEGFWGEVRVRAEDAQRARSFVDSHVSGASDISAAELEAQAAASSDPGV